MLRKIYFKADNAIVLRKLLYTLAESTSEPSTNQYFFDGSNTNGPTIKINSGAGVFGAIQFPFFNLRKRDKIRVTCEMISYSGVLPKMTLDKYTGGTLDNTNNLAYPSNEWVQFDETFNITTGDKDFKVMCGLFTNDVGIFAIRNLKIIVYSDSCVTLPDEQVFAIRKSGTEWFLDYDKGSNAGTLTVFNSASLLLVFDTPFKYFAPPMAFATQDYSSDLTTLTGNESKTQLLIRFKNVQGANVSLADMPENFYGYIRVVQMY